MKTVVIYTDGACSGNPGPGGWAAILKYGDRIKEISGYDPGPTTNNAMELTAILNAVLAMRNSGLTLHIFTDSMLAIGWLSGKARITKPHILDLIEKIANALVDGGHTASYFHVVGHSNVEMNVRADQLARGEIQKNRLSVAERLTQVSTDITIGG